MAVRILDVEFTQAGGAIEGIEGCDRALVLVRHGGVPLGQVTVPVRDGGIAAGAIRDAFQPGLVARWAALDQVGRHLPVPPERLPVRRLTATVAICTRERPDDLARALTAAAALPHRGGGVLVIDNCPATPATREVAARFPGVRYVVEPRRGLDNARNRALAEAATDIVAFIDDDAVADAGWLDALMEPFGDPDVGCVTGLTLPLELENEAQEEFETWAGFSQRGFERREFRSPPTHPLATGPIGAGANMAVRRSLLEAIGPFDPALDAGTPTQSGGDHEYFSRILRAGWTIVYEPRALNRHRHRRTRDEMLKAVRGYGTGAYAAWTRSLMVEGDRDAPRRAWGWLVHDQIPGLLHAILQRRGARPLDVALAELRGCVAGPFAYLASRRQARAEEACSSPSAAGTGA